ncbi:asparagine synthetase [Dermatophagoides pteronyssinus]|uniref:Asparagine synthetase [glutamine-hydrolyzing] n=1 Tax=Dermatophagoides pteronyssinus TaxID=6956 RepID=A0ABQ8J5R2_DERPT|nr:asparagine synthetase [Dermatophagoides pteronyssinus]
MCGIFAVLNYSKNDDVKKIRQKALNHSKRIRHRGPDWSGCVISDNNIFCHERLAIIGVDSGAQPIVSHDKSLILTVNGEIYNYRKLKNKLLKDCQFVTYSDCEVIIHLYRMFGNDFVKYLDGIFSFVLYDNNNKSYLVARDAIGVTTLYYGYNKNQPETLYFASEMKCLNDLCDTIMSFPPGHIYNSKQKSFQQWYQPEWYNESLIPTKQPVDYEMIRKKLTKAVKKRLMSEVPYGVLLSGGLDSSVIASIAARETRRMLKHEFVANNQFFNKSSNDEDLVIANNGDSSGGSSSDEQTDSYWPRLHSFSIGLPDKEVGKFLKTVHHEYTFSVQEGLDAISDVIYHLETYDVTTVRASTPMYLLSRKIKANSVKMVLSGEGSDEIFGGYLYFHSAPNEQAFQEETVKRVKNLHTSDCLRANKSTMAWGLEARVPFLDKDFLDTVMNIDPREKMCSKNRIEKYILRKAFDTSDDPDKEPYLPDSILWRQKEQFSDGVGYSWIDSLKAEAEHRITDQMFDLRHERWPMDTPMTKEAYWYREIFEMHYPQPACMESIVRWIPRTDWGCPMDPSGRAQKSHNQAYVKSTATINGNNTNNIDENGHCKTTIVNNGQNNNITTMTNGSMVH